MIQIFEKIENSLKKQKMISQQSLEAVHTHTHTQGDLIEEKRVAKATLKVMGKIDFYLVCKGAY